MSRYLLDTGIVVRHLRGNRRIVALLRGLGCTDRLGITAVTRLEIHVGMHEDERYATQKLLSRFVTYDLTAEVVDRAGDFMRTSRRGGQVVSILDAIIAATAVPRGRKVRRAMPRPNASCRQERMAASEMSGFSSIRLTKLPMVP